MTSGRWSWKPIQESAAETTGRRSLTPFWGFRLLPLNLTTLNKRNIKIMILGTGNLPNCIFAITVKELILCELMIMSHSSLECCQIGGNVLELVTHFQDALERTQLEYWWGSRSIGVFYVNWPITDKGRQSLVNTHVETVCRRQLE